MPTIEQIYQQHIKPIPIDEQLRLIELITQKLIKSKTNKSPWQALQEFRNLTDLEALNIDTTIFDKDRAEAKEREIDL